MVIQAGGFFINEGEVQYSIQLSKQVTGGHQILYL